MNTLFARALLAFLALPGIVAFLVPWLLLSPGAAGRSIYTLGLLPLGLGIVLLLWCVREFYRAGRGTLAPWEPPQRLVMTGLYRFSRNPMYIAVLLILSGWALTFRSRPIAIYAVCVLVAFHLRVVFGEEPFLAQAHGEHWTQYKARVPRWLARPLWPWASRVSDRQ
jgi:protein-S-isoprenylcysteine O-methyltransferase Ste14